MSLGGGGGGRGQLEQLSQELQAIDEQQNALRAEIEGYRVEQREIDEAIEALGGLDNGETVQVPLGGGAYLRAEIGEVDEVIVELGGGYAAERDEEGAIETLERKRDALKDRIEETNEEIEELDAESQQIEQQAQQLQQQQMQQMQGMQGGGGPGGPGGEESPDEDDDE